MRKPCRKSGGKIKFPSHEAAAIRAGEILSRPKAHPGFANVTAWNTYKCEFCNHWHLATWQDKKKRA